MSIPQMILEINTRSFLRERGLSLGGIPDHLLDEWAAVYDAVWLMGIWQPSAASRKIAAELSSLRAGYSAALPDWNDSDVAGSPFAIAGYTVNPALGGDAELAELRRRLHERGLKLIVDFVPNHTARDHAWTRDHPDYYVGGTADQLAFDSANWFWSQTENGPNVLAHGRDPHFAGWSDTAQLDYSNPALQGEMRQILARLAGLCDGVRCDMAMLVTSAVFEKTWHRKISEFWPRAIAETKSLQPDFCFIAEVYWGMESTLRDMGFDLTYDKSLLDDMISGKPLRGAQFNVPESEHRGRLRFLENHDEPRIASQLSLERHRAAAAWVYSLPSSHLIHDGQLSGQRVRTPVQLTRMATHSPDERIRAMYDDLLPVLQTDVVRHGAWQPLSPAPAWTGNDTYQAILGQGYDHHAEHVRVFVNWSDARSQCWVPLGMGSLAGKEVILRDHLTTKVFVREGLELTTRGLYLDMEPWEAHVFDCRINEVN